MLGFLSFFLKVCQLGTTIVQYSENVNRFVKLITFPPKKMTLNYYERPENGKSKQILRKDTEINHLYVI